MLYNKDNHHIEITLFDHKTIHTAHCIKS
jgi:hypothetical protein